MTDAPNPNHEDSHEGIQDSSDGARIDQLRKELLASAPEVVIANHCFGLFELAAIYLSNTPPRLSAASLTIDALSGIVEATKGRLGEHEKELTDALSQLRLAFIQVSTIDQKPKTD